MCANPSVFFQVTVVPTFTVIVDGLKDMLAMVTTLLAVPGVPGVVVFDDLLQEVLKIVRLATIMIKKIFFCFILWVLKLILL